MSHLIGAAFWLVVMIGGIAVTAALVGLLTYVVVMVVLGTLKGACGGWR
jgi:hypothetical protein